MKKQEIFHISSIARFNLEILKTDTKKIEGRHKLDFMFLIQGYILVTVGTYHIHYIRKCLKILSYTFSHPRASLLLETAEKIPDQLLVCKIGDL